MSLHLSPLGAIIGVAYSGIIGAIAFLEYNKSKDGRKKFVLLGSFLFLIFFVSEFIWATRHVGSDISNWWSLIFLLAGGYLIRRNNLILGSLLFLSFLVCDSIWVNRHVISRTPGDWWPVLFLFFGAYCFEKSGLFFSIKLFKWNKPSLKKFIFIASIFFGTIACGILVIEFFLKSKF